MSTVPEGEDEFEGDDYEDDDQVAGDDYSTDADFMAPAVTSEYVEPATSAVAEAVALEAVVPSDTTERSAPVAATEGVEPEVTKPEVVEQVVVEQVVVEPEVVESVIFDSTSPAIDPYSPTTPGVNFDSAPNEGEERDIEEVAADEDRGAPSDTISEASHEDHSESEVAPGEVAYDPYEEFDREVASDPGESLSVVPVDSELPEGVEMPGTGEAAIFYPPAAPGIPLDTKGVSLDMWAPELDPRVRAAIEGERQATKTEATPPPADAPPHD